MARTRKHNHTVDKLDRGTPETRRRVSADPLVSTTIEPHRAAAGFAIRSANEKGLGPRGLDVVRIAWAVVLRHPAAVAAGSRRTA